MAMDYELNELRREFLHEARGKVAEMQTALETHDAASRERLAYLAHQLKGSGGSYGYQSISTESAAVEKAVEGLSGDPAEEAAILLHVNNLRAEIDRCARELVV